MQMAAENHREWCDPECKTKGSHGPHQLDFTGFSKEENVSNTLLRLQAL